MTSREDPTLVPVERITHAILIVRGQRVIIDRDLAAIYGVATGRLNEAVKRNAERFPEDFLFRLTQQEAERSRSQIAILKSRRGYNLKYLPHVFTEHGAIQAANVLNSPRAVMMGIHVVRAFVQLRDLLASNKELAHKFAELERKLATHDQAITGILKTIRELMNPPESERRGIGFTADFAAK
jgi:hypothetical protein